MQVLAEHKSQTKNYIGAKRPVPTVKPPFLSINIFDNDYDIKYVYC